MPESLGGLKEAAAAVAERLSASIKFRVPLHTSGVDRVRAGLDAASGTGSEIGYRSGAVTSADGREITIWLSLDPVQILDAYPALRKQAQEEERERIREALEVPADAKG